MIRKVLGNGLVIGCNCAKYEYTLSLRYEQDCLTNRRDQLQKSADMKRIYHECEGRIEKSVPRISVWHHDACRLMANGDPEGRIFLSYPHTYNGFFFLLTTVFIYSFIFDLS